jgi:hypothetical protein
VVGLTAATADADVGKPVKLSATANAVDLCADGDAIYGWIDSIETSTSNGRVVAAILEKGTCRVTTSGAVAIGDVVEAGANAAAGTAPTSWGVVSTKAVIADLIDAATGAQIATAVNALIADAAAGTQVWRAITGGTTGVDIVIAKD